MVQISVVAFVIYIPFQATFLFLLFYFFIFSIWGFFKYTLSFKTIIASVFLLYVMDEFLRFHCITLNGDING